MGFDLIHGYLPRGHEKEPIIREAAQRTQRIRWPRVTPGCSDITMRFPSVKMSYAPPDLGPWLSRASMDDFDMVEPSEPKSIGPYTSDRMPASYVPTKTENGEARL
jgi:hypothetical protein